MSVLEENRVTHLANYGHHTLAICQHTGRLAVSDGPRIFIHSPGRVQTLEHILTKPEFVAIETLRFSGNGKRLVAGMQDESVVLYDPLSCEEVEVLTKHAHQMVSYHDVPCVDLDMDAGIVVSGSVDRTVRVCCGQTRAVGKGHRGMVTGVTLLGTGETFVSVSVDQTLSLWNLQCERLSLLNLEDCSRSVASSLCGSSVVIGLNSGKVILFDTETWGEKWSSDRHVSSAKSVALQGNYVVTGAQRDTLKLLDADTGNLVCNLGTVRDNDIRAVAFSPDGSSLFVTGYGTLLTKIPLHPEKMCKLASFLHASEPETMFLATRDHHPTEDMQNVAFQLLRETLGPMIMRSLF